MNILSLPQRILGYILIAVIFISQGLMFYWAFWPYEPLKIEYITIQDFKNGEYITYKMKFIKKMDLPAEVSKQFINGYIITLPTITANYPVGEGCTTHQVEIPKLPPGNYYFQWSGRYRVNPIREVTVTARTPRFEIK